MPEAASSSWPSSAPPRPCPRLPSRVCGARRTSPYGGRMTGPGPGVLSTAHSAHGAAPVAREQTDWRKLSGIDATCPSVNSTNRGTGRNRPTGCNILLAGPQGRAVFRDRFLNCSPRPAATSGRATGDPSALVNAPDLLARASRISTELVGALSVWASPLSEIHWQHMQQGKGMSQETQGLHRLQCGTCVRKSMRPFRLETE